MYFSSSLSVYDVLLLKIIALEGKNVSVCICVHVCLCVCAWCAHMFAITVKHWILEKIQSYLSLTQVRKC